MLSKSMQEQVVDHEEIEWQLEVVELGLVENWLKEHSSASGVAVVPEPASELSDVYYDTEDWTMSSPRQETPTASPILQRCASASKRAGSGGTSPARWHPRLRLAASPGLLCYTGARFDPGA
jgi:hypothetical protein